MSHQNTAEIVQLKPENISEFEAMMTVFGEAFEDVAGYCDRRPSRAYVQKLLSDDTFIAIAALVNGNVVGGLTAYELRKFEQECSEVYIYDLAIAEPFRRQGIATATIKKLREICSERGNVRVIFVQADYEDPPAIALYETLGRREEVLHFDIDVP